MGAPRFRVPAEKSERFRELARVPGVAWPTLGARSLAVLGLLLLGPLLQFQNDHLVHHLFPALPSR